MCFDPTSVVRRFRAVVDHLGIHVHDRGASERDDATVDAFHAAAIAAGYPDSGPPGERQQYHPGSNGASVLDPDG